MSITIPIDKAIVDASAFHDITVRVSPPPCQCQQQPHVPFEMCALNSQRGSRTVARGYEMKSLLPAPQVGDNLPSVSRRRSLLAGTSPEDAGNGLCARVDGQLATVPGSTVRVYCNGTVDGRIVTIQIRWVDPVQSSWCIKA